MSTSPLEPENAAPTVPMRPEQASEPAQSTDQNNARRVATRRNHSPPNISQLSPPSITVDEPSAVAVGPVELAERVANTNNLWSVSTKGNDLDDIYIQKFSQTSMATTMPPAKPPALSAGGTPALASKEFDISDIGQVNSLLIGHRDLLRSRNSRGTSLERTQREKRVQDFSTLVFSHNPGDTGLINPPASNSSTAPAENSDNQSLDGVRASYRSWRDAHPGITEEKVWSFGEQASGEVPEGQVEKSVAEALAGIEPNNRSRKASHSLRFFREGLPQEKPKRREVREMVRTKDPLARMEDSLSEDIDNVHDEKTTNFHDELGHNSSPSNTETPINTLDGVEHHGNVTSSSDSLHPQVGKKLNTLPTHLLDDLRKQHNLMPAPSRGFSFSHSLPVTESEKSKMPREAPQTTVGDVAHGATTEKKSTTRDEDDESGEEKISSALFVPHKTSHESPEREVLGLEDHHQSEPSSQKSGPSNTDGWLVPHEVPPRIVDDDTVGKASPHGLLEAVHDQSQEQEHDNYFPDPFQIPDLSCDTVSETGYWTKDEESSFTDDTETIPVSRVNGKLNVTESQQDHLHRHQKRAKAPLEAIELIPYRHQVGGHTTMWRFSKRAVCKQLNNRENEFYERIERYHPKLLKFMPRYIGVLNVTFEKQQKRKASGKENSSIIEGEVAGPELQENAKSNIAEDAVDLAKPPIGDDRNGDHPRLVSQSINSVQSPAPTVTFADNRHIIPKSFQQPSIQDQEAVRRYLRQSSFGGSLQTRRLGQSQPPLPNGDLTFGPVVPQKQATSWGATTVNKKLRNEVFGEAFLQQPTPTQRHRRPAYQTHTSAHQPGQPGAPSQLRTSNSESNLVSTQQDQSALIENSKVIEGGVQNLPIKTANGHKESVSLKKSGTLAADSPGNVRQVSEQQKVISSDLQVKEMRTNGGLSVESIVDLHQTKRKRRYSSGSLRRKPEEDAEDRSNIKYLEKAENAVYSGLGEDDIPHVESDEPIASNDIVSQDPKAKNPRESVPEAQASSVSESLPIAPKTESAVPPDGQKSINGVVPMLRPVNPKEAQTQRDKRVEFFLLLEDLTAGMKRPCIMDLKMGTRQYGVDANEKKQISQRRKCAETTSKELGVRVCGLQVWDVKKQSYHFQDKYFGRRLKAGREFQDALQRFLFDGVGYASILRHIPTILHKLSELEVLIKDLRGYRFYAASLLMFYDGEMENDDANKDTSSMTRQSKARKREIDFKIADFANCVTAEHGPSYFKEKTCPPQHPYEPDRGFLRGLKSLRRYFIKIQKEVVDSEKRRVADIKEAESIIFSGDGLAEDLLNEDLGEVSY